MDILHVGLVQYAPVWCDPKASLDRIRTLLEVAPRTDLLVLPEMGLTGFTMEPERATLSEEIRQALSELARERETGIIYGAVEEGRNRAVLLGRDGNRLGAYDKRHLFSLGGESEHYVPGTETTIWNFGKWRIRPAICYDLRFPYQFWGEASDYDLIVVPACWPGSREANWKALLVARAIENQAWAVGVNRIGEEPKLRYRGASCAVDPLGSTVLDAQDREGIHVVQIEHGKVETARTRFPFLADRL
jgi:predicted amidohydrolase